MMRCKNRDRHLNQSVATTRCTTLLVGFDRARSARIRHHFSERCFDLPTTIDVAISFAGLRPPMMQARARGQEPMVLNNLGSELFKPGIQRWKVFVEVPPSRPYRKIYGVGALPIGCFRSAQFRQMSLRDLCPAR